jgi:hypothetical protein
VGEVHHLPLSGREFFIASDGSVLRTTWHVDRDLVNLSVWRGDRCTETFQLARADAARLIAHLADGLASVASATDAPTARPTSTAWTRTTAGLRRIVTRRGSP